jgi:uncharacterized protein
MRLLPVLAITVILFTAAPAVVAAQEAPLDPALRADIQRLMDLTGAAQMGHQIASILSQQVLQSTKRLHPDIPDRVIEISKEVTEQELSKVFDRPDGMVAQVIPLYAKHFSREDIRGLIAFYESDLGRRAVAEMPALMQESAQIGQRFAADIGPRIQATLNERLKAEGLVK